MIRMPSDLVLVSICLDQISILAILKLQPSLVVIITLKPVFQEIFGYSFKRKWRYFNHIAAYGCISHPYLHSSQKSGGGAFTERTFRIARILEIEDGINAHISHLVLSENRGYHSHRFCRLPSPECGHIPGLLPIDGQ